MKLSDSILPTTYDAIVIKVPALNGQHVWASALNDHLYVSPTESVFPPLAYRPDDCPPRDLRNTLHSYAMCPWMAYIPWFPCFQGPLFGRLACGKSGFPLVRVGNQWILKEEVATRWYRLEAALTNTISILSIRHKMNSWYPPPTMFGYASSVKDSSLMDRCIRRSREAFIPLMARCSYLIDRCESADGGTGAWTELLKERGNVHDDWIKLFQETQVCNISAPRVGAVITPDCDWLEDVPMMLRSNIPLWFRWHRDDLNAFSGTSVDGYRPLLLPARPDTWPPPFQIVRLDLQGEIQTSEKLIPEEKPDAAKFPEPHPNSGQKKGESLQDFLQRRIERRSLLEAGESAKSRQIRLDREKVNERGACPGKKSKVKVWQWVVDPESGFRLRTEVYKREWESIWDDYTSSRRVYDSFSNEWDVCTELDPSEAVKPGNFYDDLEDDDGEFSHFPDNPPQQLSNEAVYAGDVRDTFGYDASGYEGMALGEEWAPTEFEKVLHERYGMVCSDDWMDAFSEAGVQTVDISGRHPMRVLVENPKSELDDEFCQMIGNFVKCLSETGSIPGPLWDLSPSRSPSLRVKGIVLNGTDFYVLNSDKEDGPVWTLAVKDAATVLQCLRSTITGGKYEMVNGLLASGVPFNTLIPGPRPDRYRFDKPSRGLGCRAHGYQPDATDYAVYERDRGRVASGPSGRAGLLMGGIVWRLIKDAVETDASAIAGPSDGVFDHGAAYETENGYLWDDKLSEEELDIICGVYKVKSSNNRVEADCSWWPKHSAWSENGLDVGYWSSGCEVWYQNRLALIKEGKATLFTGNKWRSNLKFLRKETRLLISNNELASAAAITRDFL